MSAVAVSAQGSTLGPSPPAAKVEMDKGKGGKGKKWTSWPREVGTYPYLKNFRKGLHHQLGRCLRDLQASPDPATRCFVDTRLVWILAKFDLLDNFHVMVWDRPAPWDPQMEYGSLEPAARRCLTDEEIKWNKVLIQAEGRQQRRGSASAAIAATPAAATAPTPEQLHDLERFRRFALLVNEEAIAETARLVAEAEAQEKAKQALMQAILEADQRTPSCYGRLSTSPSTSMDSGISAA